jgi:hypothetical protein
MLSRLNLRYRTTLLLIALAGLGVANAQADSTNTIRVLYSGEYHRVWTLYWGPRYPAADSHVHEGPTVIIFTRNGTLRLRDGRRERHKMGDVLYHEAGVALNDGVLQSDDDYLEAMVLELRSPPPERSWDVPEFPAFPRDGARQVLDNARVTAWDVRYNPDQPSGFHRHEKLTVFLFWSAGKFEFSFRSNRPAWRIDARHFGSTAAFPGAIDSEQAAGASMRSLQVEIK